MRISRAGRPVSEVSRTSRTVFEVSRTGRIVSEADGIVSEAGRIISEAGRIVSEADKQVCKGVALGSQREPGARGWRPVAGAGGYNSRVSGHGSHARTSRTRL